MGEMHHLKVGCADASIILNNGATFLVDTHGIDDYAHFLPKDKKIGGAFITHQHYDHFDGLQYLKDKDYSIEHLIYSPYDRRYNDTSVKNNEWNDFLTLRNHFANRGTKTYAPYRQDQWQKPFWEINGLKFWIIGPDPTIAKRDTRELHDACLVVLMEVSAKDRKCLFAGDA